MVEDWKDEHRGMREAYNKTIGEIFLDEMASTGHSSQVGAQDKALLDFHDKRLDSGRIFPLTPTPFAFSLQVSLLFSSSSSLTITSFISPYKADRDLARDLHSKHDPALPFIEVFIDASVEECEKRDPKGLYKKARAGEIKGELFVLFAEMRESSFWPFIGIHSDLSVLFSLSTTPLSLSFSILLSSILLRL